jgi:hypothetical protein
MSRFQMKGKGGSMNVKLRIVVRRLIYVMLGTLMAVSVSTSRQNPQLVPVLQALLQKYKGCILERYETQDDMRNRGLDPRLSGLSSTNGLQDRDTVMCVAGNACSRASRLAIYNMLQGQASRGDVTNFEASLKQAIPADCFQCEKHQEWHTKHVHCTMDCGGNNGLTKGPCFEGCKAGVDITKLVNDTVNDIHGKLAGIGIVHDQSPTTANNKPSTIGGASIATNYAVVDPRSVPEPCDPRPCQGIGYFVASPDLLDWTPTDAPQFKGALTNYVPPPSPRREQYNSAALFSNDPAQKLNIGANEGRLRQDLRDVAARHNPIESLCKSAAAFAAGNVSDGNAFADLSVTGRLAFAAFRAKPPQEAEILACLHNDARSKAIPEANLQRAVGAALDRAYRVLQVIRIGGWADPLSCPERSALGYIAVSGEDDQPHRPVNVPSGEFPQYDLDVLVQRPDVLVAKPNGAPVLTGTTPLSVHTRFMIAHTFPPQGAARQSCAMTGRSIPADRAPVLAPNAEVFLYIHGMDSRLEEALDLAHALHALGRQTGKNYTVISMDLPTSGYADNIDYNMIAALSADGQAGGGLDGLGFAPIGYNTPVVDFIENFIVSFVNTLDRSTQVAHREVVPIGGSLGGNMAFRLGRPRTDAPWIKNVVSWSPAAIWPSFADDGTKHVALAVPWYLAGGDPAFGPETPGARRSYFYGGFDWQSKVLGLIPVDGHGGRPQSEYWVRDGFPGKFAHTRLARIDRYETYNHNFRLWHWRLGMEQLLFSQQIPKPGVRPPEPLYLSNTKRMLLLCGIEDVGGDLCKNTRDVAPKMSLTPGRALFLQTTGHSIHSERPNFLARQIVDFIATGR